MSAFGAGDRGFKSHRTRCHMYEKILVFSFLASFVEHLEVSTLGAKTSESKVILCLDFFWCGRCSEPTNQAEN